MRMDRYLTVLPEIVHHPNRYTMQKKNKWQGGQAPARNNPLNTDFRPGGEEERWPEDPEADAFTEKYEEPGTNRSRPGPDDESFDDDEWERIIREYKIY